MSLRYELVGRGFSVGLALLNHYPHALCSTLCAAEGHVAVVPILVIHVASLSRNSDHKQLIIYLSYPALLASIRSSIFT